MTANAGVRRLERRCAVHLTGVLATQRHEAAGVDALVRPRIERRRPVLDGVVGAIGWGAVPVAPPDAVEQHARTTDAQQGVDARAVVEVDVVAGGREVVRHHDPGIAIGCVIACGVEPCDASGHGVVHDCVERARAVSWPVVGRSERPGEDAHAVVGEEVDRCLEVCRRSDGGQVQLGGRRGVLHDLGNRHAMLESVAVVDTIVETRVAEVVDRTCRDRRVLTEAVVRIRQRPLLRRTPQAEVEVVNDAHLHRSPDARCLPVRCIGQRHVLPRHRAGSWAELTDGWFRTRAQRRRWVRHPQRRTHERRAVGQRELVDTPGRHACLHQLPIDFSGDRPTKGTYGVLDVSCRVSEHLHAHHRHPPAAWRHGVKRVLDRAHERWIGDRLVRIGRRRRVLIHPGNHHGWCRRRGRDGHSSDGGHR